MNTIPTRFSDLCVMFPCSVAVALDREYKRVKRRRIRKTTYSETLNDMYKAARTEYALTREHLDSVYNRPSVFRELAESRFKSAQPEKLGWRIELGNFSSLRRR